LAASARIAAVTTDGPARFEGVHCTLRIERPAPGVLVVVFAGTDIGEFGAAPFRELERSMPGDGRIELYIDARDGQTASIDVSAEWARWLQIQRSRFDHVSMLTRSRFIQLSADFVKRFAEMGEVMRLYTDPAAFDQALAAATATATAGGGVGP
jgi:hypothetical protein